MHLSQSGMMQTGAIPLQDTVLSAIPQNFATYSTPQEMMTYSAPQTTAQWTYSSPTLDCSSLAPQTSTAAYSISVLAFPAPSEAVPTATATPVPEPPPVMAFSYETPATMKATRIRGMARHVPGKVKPEHPVLQAEVVSGDRLENAGSFVPPSAVTYAAPTGSEAIMYSAPTVSETMQYIRQVPQATYTAQGMVMPPTSVAPYFPPQQSIIYGAPQTAPETATHNTGGIYATPAYAAQGDFAVGVQVGAGHQTYPAPQQIVTYGMPTPIQPGYQESATPCAMPQQRGVQSRFDVDQLFNQLDINHDGVLSRSEFLVGVVGAVARKK